MMFRHNLIMMKGLCDILQYKCMDMFLTFVNIYILDKITFGISLLNKVENYRRDASNTKYVLA